MEYVLNVNVFVDLRGLDLIVLKVFIQTISNCGKLDIRARFAVIDEVVRDVHIYMYAALFALSAIIGAIQMMRLLRANCYFDTLVIIHLLIVLQGTGIL
jgi:hypothetical protein